MTHVAEVLQQAEDAIVADAGEACARSHLAHYEAAPRGHTKARLRALVDVVIRGCESNCLDEARSYGAFLALDRRTRGFGLDEVQVTVNAAEAAVWRCILLGVDPAEQGPALGLVSTILGAMKDSLACAYVQSSASHPLGTWELEALFAGTEAGGPAA